MREGLRPTLLRNYAKETRMGVKVERGLFFFLRKEELYSACMLMAVALQEGKIYADLL